MKIDIPVDVGDKVYPLAYGYYPEMVVISVSIWLDKPNIYFWECEMESEDHECYDTFDMDDWDIRVFSNKERRDHLLEQAIERELTGEIK